MGKPRRHLFRLWLWLVGGLVAVGAVACGGRSTLDPFGPCTKNSDCPQGICVAGRCQPLQTLDPDADVHAGLDSSGEADSTAPGDLVGEVQPGADAVVSSDGKGPDATVLACSSNVDCAALQKTLASCQAAYCDPASKRCKVKSVEDGTFCDDLDACTVGDRCKAGVCTGQAKCSASPCQTASCDSQTGECSTKPLADGSLCDDGDPCTTSDRCLKGECRSPINICPCTNSGACSIYENGNRCDGTYVCESGYCRLDPKTRVSCEGLVDGPCQAAICDPETGSCNVVDLDDGTTCNDGNPCTTGDTCKKGVCLGTAVDCSSEDRECRTGFCDETTGVCRGKPLEDGTSCTDDNLCTTSDSCQKGVCVGTPKVCAIAGNPCKQGFCDPGTGGCRSKPINEGGECDDKNPCTSKDICLGGTCSGVNEPYGALCSTSVGSVALCDAEAVCHGSEIAFWPGPELSDLRGTSFDGVWRTSKGPLLLASVDVGPDPGMTTRTQLLVPLDGNVPLASKPLGSYFGETEGLYLGFAPTVALRVESGVLQWLALNEASPPWKLALDSDAASALSDLGFPLEGRPLAMVEHSIDQTTTEWRIANPLSNALVQCKRGGVVVACNSTPIAELTAIAGLAPASENDASFFVAGPTATGQGIYLLPTSGPLAPSCAPSEPDCDLGGYLGLARFADGTMIAVGRKPAVLRRDVGGESWTRLTFPTLPLPLGVEELTPPSPGDELRVQSFVVDGAWAFLFALQRSCTDASCADGALRLLMATFHASNGFANHVVDLTASICAAPSERCRCTDVGSCDALASRFTVAGAVVLSDALLLVGTLPLESGISSSGFTLAIPRAPQPDRFVDELPHRRHRRRDEI